MRELPGRPPVRIMPRHDPTEPCFEVLRYGAWFERHGRADMQESIDVELAPLRGERSA